MTSNRDRRAAARARLERDMAVRAGAARRRRHRQEIIGGAIAAVFVIGAVIWVVTALGGKSGKPTASASPTPSATTAAKPTSCVWQPLVDPSATPTPQPKPSGAREVGKPPANEPRTGIQVMTITTNQGVIKVEMDVAKSPCIAASFTYLASKNFFNDTKCHRLVPGIGALQCGDPVGDGSGGPTYRFADENLPVGQRPAYARGLVAMANSGPGTNGSQFFFVYKDSDLQPQYAVIGKITAGLDIIDKIANAGHDGAYDPQPGGGHPKLETIIKSVTVSAPAAP